MAKQSFNFKKTLEELEKLSEWFQQPDIDLDEALKKYQRGMELVKEAQAHLKKTENEFKRVSKTLVSEE